MNETPLAFSSRLMVALIATGFVLAGVMLLPLAGPTQSWGLLTGGLLGLMLLGKPGTILFLYWMWSATINLVSLVYANSLFRIVDELLVAMMMLMVLGERVFNRRRSPDLRVFDSLTGALLALTAVSAVINRVRPLPAVHFVSTYFGFILVFYLGFYHFRTDRTRLKFALVILMFLLQFALNFGWQFAFNPIPNYRWGTVDFAIGSFGSCDLVAYFTVFVMLLLYPIFKRVRRPLRRAGVVFLGVLAAFQLYITFTAHAYFLLVVGVAIQLGLLYRSFREYMTAASAILVAVVVIVGLDVSGIAKRYMGGSSIAESLAPRAIAARWTAMEEGPKGRAYRDVLLYAPKDMFFWPVGAGPGNFASAIGARYRSVLAERYVNYVFFDYSGRSEQVGSSVTQSVLTGAMAMWSELGPGGFLLFFGLHGYALLRLLRQLRRGAYRDPYRQVLVEALIPSIALYLGLNLLTDLFPHDVLQGGLWLLIASVWRADPPPTPAAAAPVAGAAGPGLRGTRVMRPL